MSLNKEGVAREVGKWVSVNNKVVVRWSLDWSRELFLSRKEMEE